MTSLISIIVVVAPAGSIAGGGTPLSVVNAGFETDAAPPGCFEILTPAGWSVYDPNNLLGGGNVVGVIDPTGTTNFPAGAPEGLNVALVYMEGSAGAGPMGLTQVLTDTLAANTRYTLTVEVGDIDSGQGPPPCDTAGFFNLKGFPGYQIQILAGGVVVAEDDNSLAGSLTEGMFATSTTILDVPGGHPQLGQALEIRLINLNNPGTPEEPGIEVDFDDVMLMTEPLPSSIPAVSDWGLLTAALALLVVGSLLLQRRSESKTCALRR